MLVPRTLIATVTPTLEDTLTLALLRITARITTSSTGTVARLVGSGGTAPYTYFVLSGSLPTGMTLTGATGEIKVTGALTRGTYTFTAVVQDSAGDSFPHTFVLVVNGNLIATSFTPPDLTAARAPSSQPYSFFFEVSGNVGTVSWALQSGSLPTGMVVTTVGNRGRIGTATALHPTSATTYYFTVRATDAGTGETLDIPAHFTLYPTATFTFTNGDPTHAFYYAQTELPPCVQNVPTTYQVNVAPGKGKPPFTWECTVSSTVLVTLPASDIVLTPINNGQSCLITITTGVAVGRYSIAMLATDANGYKVAADSGTINPAGYNVNGPLFFLAPAQVGVQPQLAGSDLGTRNFGTFNITGGGVASATNVNGTVTYTINTGAGGVTSVALTMPAIFSVSGSPVTSTGMFAVALASQSANLIWAGPTTGTAAPTFRAMVAADLPAGVARLLFAKSNTADQVTNTTTFTLFGTTYTLPANSVAAGTIIKVRAAGRISTAPVAPSLSLQFQFGGVNTLNIGPMVIAASMAGQQWSFECTLMFPGSGTVAVDCEGVVIVSAGSTTAATVVCPTPQAVTRNMAATQVFQFGAQWSAASTSNSILLNQFNVEIERL